MPATIIDANRKALEERVDKGGAALNDALTVLADSLGEYGFKGELKLHLTVSIDDKVCGGVDTVLERSTLLHFRR